MLLNAYLEPQRAKPYIGTRILTDSLNLNLRGVEVREPEKPERRWLIQTLFAPVPGRALGGIRAKLVDDKGFITFCNQRDLEVLLGDERIGAWCRWTGQYYVSPDDPEWFGLCADDDDLLDDLQERELILRSSIPGGVLVPPLEIVRRVHTDLTHDYEELRVFTQESYDQSTGFFPDSRLETVVNRWVRSHRDRIPWDRC